MCSSCPYSLSLIAVMFCTPASVTLPAFLSTQSEQKQHCKRFLKPHSFRTLQTGSGRDSVWKRKIIMCVNTPCQSNHRCCHSTCPAPFPCASACFGHSPASKQEDQNLSHKSNTKQRKDHYHLHQSSEYHHKDMNSNNSMVWTATKSGQSKTV